MTGTTMEHEQPFGEAEHLACTLDYYRRMARGYDLQSVRSGHSDAAHMCDAIAADILREHTVRGRVTNKGKELFAAVKRAGDAIWAMRAEMPGRKQK